MMGQTEKREKLYEAITELPDEFILEAEEDLAVETDKMQEMIDERAVVKKKAYLKWVLAAAACLLLFCGGIVSGLLLAENRQPGGLTQTKNDGEREGFQFLVHNMAMNNTNSTNSSPSETLYSNYVNTYMNSNIAAESHTELTDLYQLYGITSGDEIEKVVCSKGNHVPNAVTVTQEEALEEFYQLTTELERCSIHVFFNTVIDKMSNMEIAAFHEECRLLEITTTNGLVFTYSIYPRSGWLYSGGTMSYYVLSDELLDWYTEHCE